MKKETVFHNFSSRLEGFQKSEMNREHFIILINCSLLILCRFPSSDFKTLQPVPNVNKTKILLMKRIFFIAC